MEEVLQRQPERIRNFLLQTSILDRLSGPLCDAVTGREDGQAMLETLERGNLFVVPLDDRRQWYRYHHLFAEVLQARLLEALPTQVAILHRRASAWHERTACPPMQSATRWRRGFRACRSLIELEVGMMRGRLSGGNLEGLGANCCRAESWRTARTRRVLCLCFITRRTGCRRGPPTRCRTVAGYSGTLERATASPLGGEGRRE